jgi:hypothetical protein
LPRGQRGQQVLGCRADLVHHHAIAPVE